MVASFTSGPGASTLPMLIYSKVKLGVTPEINAVCTILIAIVYAAILLMNLFIKYFGTSKQVREANANVG